MNRLSVFPSKLKTKCKMCPVEVRKDRMSDHIKRYHSDENKEKNDEKHSLQNFFKSRSDAPKKQMEMKTVTEEVVCILSYDQ